MKVAKKDRYGVWHLNAKCNVLWTEYLKPLRPREPFQTPGAFRSRVGKPITLGILPSEFRRSANQASYVVYSWDTPIAWFVPNNYAEASMGTTTVQMDGGSNVTITYVAGGYWVQPDHKYSSSTSNHQSKIATALSVINDPAY